MTKVRVHVALLAAAILAVVIGLVAPQSASAATGVWRYQANGDYAHVTNGDASGHGWWTWTDAGAPVRTATVVMNIQKFNQTTRVWDIMKVSSQSGQLPGSGSAVRLNVRQPCNGTALNTWRTYVVVAITMQPGDKFAVNSEFYSPGQPINCG